ncbi:MAG: response regulator transcription factor [Phycisphaerales bacterium]|nr:response regulator transcription factor [Phycisphaerales bacterium]MCB9836252.1 response regulator transcription factor [Phycisphaera sp.]
MRVLVVEDSNRLRDSLREGLAASGYAVDAQPDGVEGLASARAIDYDAIVLDVMMPNMDGLEMLRQLREHGIQTPVLMLTARDHVDHRVEGLRSGADDYLVKPFAFEELLARIEALCRRSSGHTQNHLSIGGLCLDLGAKRALFQGQAIELPPREYSILELLAMNSGRVMARHEIEEHIYDAQRQVWSNSIDSAVASLRRHLDRFGLRDLILTRRGIGYMINATTDSREDEL